MRRYIFPLPYAGDPTKGYVTPSLPAPLDKSELVQPATGALYPPAPASHVLVGLGCNALDLVEDSHAKAAALVAAGTPSRPADVPAFNQASQSLPALKAAFDAEYARLVPLMDAAAAELAADGFTQLAVTDAF